jgi:NitT/TauT family transport system substrate-binding protein
MNGHRGARLAPLQRTVGIAVMLAVALAAGACAPTAGPASSAPSGAPPAGAGASAPAVGGASGGSAASAPAQPSRGPIGQAGAKPEKTNLKIGLPVAATSFMPIYLAADRTYQEEGLNVELLSFRGDADVAQALAADSVDINVASLNGLINMLTAGQPVTGFYAGFFPADFAWIARPDVKSWSDLRSKSVGISTYGALTDFLTRYALRKHGLEPERDVQIVQAGGSPQAAQTLKAGRLDAAILSPPFKWNLADEGFTTLGTQATEIGEQWPKHIFIAKERFLDENPNTVRAVLRAHVRALRLAKADPSAPVASFEKWLKYTHPDAERAQAEVANDFDERGNLPTQWMPVFWEIAVAAGDVTEPWPESKLLDRRFVDTFDQWAPQ